MGDDLVAAHNSTMLGIHCRMPGSVSRRPGFTAPQVAWWETQAIAVGDLNNDGCKDLALASIHLTGTLVYRGLCTAPGARVRAKSSAAR